MIGVDFNNPSSTALFGLGTEVLGTQASEWTYCIATGTLSTGMIVSVFSAGTAYALTTALVNGGDVLLTTGQLNLGAVQTLVPQGQYAWVARKGISLYVACTGTCTGGAEYAFSPSAGVIWNAPAAGVGATARGIFLTTSASTATLSVAVGTLSFPRPIASVPGA
jgi:hypothetical protein